MNMKLKSIFCNLIEYYNFKYNKKYFIISVNLIVNFKKIKIFLNIYFGEKSGIYNLNDTIISKNKISSEQLILDYLKHKNNIQNYRKFSLAKKR